jgi:glycosyltransferase involved in cell wall biosynthesis
MSNVPLVTIGITCFNASATIARAIDSARRQTWENVEIVVVDDCSSDGSVKIIEEAILSNHRASCLSHEKNLGPAAARNTIIEQATGEFIAFFDDDDESLPERLATQLGCLTAYEEETGEKVVACFASGYREYPNGYLKPLQAIGSRPEPPKGKELVDYVLFYQKKPGVFYGAGTPTCALFVRRSVLTEVGGFDENLRRVEDADLAIRLAFQGAHFIGCPQSLFIQHSTQALDKSAAKNLEAEVRLAEKNKAYLMSVNRYHYARLWPYLRYYHFTGEHRLLAQTLCSLFLRYPYPVMRHLMATAPRRLLHELKMRRKRIRP